MPLQQKIGSLAVEFWTPSRHQIWRRDGLVAKPDESTFQKFLSRAKWIPFAYPKIKSPNTTLCVAPGLKMRQKGQIFDVF